MNKKILILAGLSFLLTTRAAVIYQNNFEQEPLDQPPASFLVLDGDFTVKASEGGKCLELPGAPLDAFGALFGPATNGNLTVSARVFGTGKGRRFPTFGVGLDGGGGFKLQVSPAKDALEIFHGDAALTNAPFKWRSGVWTSLRLRVQAEGAGAWRIEGKAWLAGATEPSDWMVRASETNAPAAGRASLWGSPISGTPLRFDDLVLTTE
jgi:hypothetical protein